MARLEREAAGRVSSIEFLEGTVIVSYLESSDLVRSVWVGEPITQSN